MGKKEIEVGHINRKRRYMSEDLGIMRRFLEMFSNEIL